MRHPHWSRSYPTTEIDVYRTHRSTWHGGVAGCRQGSVPARSRDSLYLRAGAWRFGRGEWLLPHGGGDR